MFSVGVLLPSVWVLNLSLEGHVFLRIDLFFISFLPSFFPFFPFFPLQLMGDHSSGWGTCLSQCCLKTDFCFPFLTVSLDPGSLSCSAHLASPLPFLDGDTDVSRDDSLLETQAVGRAHRREETLG